MQEPSPVRIDTPQLLQQLMTKKNHNLYSVSIESQTLINLIAVANLISAHHQTLQTLIINGEVLPKVLYSENQVLKLIAAIKQCQNLKKLAIINFRYSFGAAGKYLVSCLSEIQTLTEVSFSKTYIPPDVDNLMSPLSNSNVETLDLTHTMLGYNKSWYNFWNTFAQNRTVKKLIFGDTPIIVRDLSKITGSIASQNTLCNIEWNPSSDEYTNATLYVALAKNINPNNPPIIPGIPLQTIGGHERCMTALHVLKGIVSGQSAAQPAKKLEARARNERHFDLGQIALHIFLQRDEVEEIILSCDVIEKENPYIATWSVELLILALKQCRKLASLKIINLQGSLIGYTSAIIYSLANLPSLKSLCITDTYLDEDGVHAIAKLQETNTSLRLDLTTVGPTTTDDAKTTESDNHAKGLKMTEQSTEVTVTKISQLEELLSAENSELYCLKIHGMAAAKLLLISRVIEKYKDSLQVLEMRGDYQVYFAEQQVKALADALSRCQKLTKLSILNYKSAFRNEIQHLERCLMGGELEELSFNNTSLPANYKQIQFLIPCIEKSKSLRVLDLTHSLETGSSGCHLIFTALKSSISLQQVILGPSPICYLDLNQLRVSLLSSSIKTIWWNPPANYFANENQIRRLQPNFRGWDSGMVIPQVELLNEPKQDGNSEYAFEQQKHQNCLIQLERLKKDLADREKPSTETKLTFVGKNEFDFDFASIIWQIWQHRNTLQELTIRCEKMGQGVPFLGADEIASLTKALTNCSQLTTLKIEQMKETFIPHIKDIFKALNNLPHLRNLSFNDTLLDEQGMDGISMLLKNGMRNIVELDVTLTGIISPNGFLSLLNAIKQNITLQKLILGKSPMIFIWANKLVTLAETKRGLKISWIHTPTFEMLNAVQFMCKRLIAANSRTQANIEHEQHMLSGNIQQNPKISCTDLEDFVKRGCVLESNNMVTPQNRQRRVDEMELKAMAAPLISKDQRKS